MEYQVTKQDEGKKDAVLLAFAYDNELPPEDQPDAYSMVLESRALGVPIYQGALWDWPYILRLEINAAIDGETQYTNRHLENAQRKVEFQQQLSSGKPQ